MENEILRAALLLIPMILSLTVHEYSHARVAYMMKDPTASDMGRLTLNPVPHIDPIGTIFLPLMGFMFGGFIFGWAKPVPVNPLNFTRKIPLKTSMLLVAGAGPLSNMILAILASLLNFLLIYMIGIEFKMLNLLFAIFIQLNVILAFFNLLPIPPLDGGRILAGVLPDRYGPMLASVEKYGFIVLIMLLFSGILKYLFIPARMISDFLLTWPAYII